MVDACASLCDFAASQLRRNIDRTFCIFAHLTVSESKDDEDHMELKKRLKRNDEIYQSLSNSMPQTVMETCAKFRQTIAQQLGGPHLFVRSAKEAKEIGS